MSAYVQGLAAPDVEARLLGSLEELQRAESHALLWFCEILDRKLYRDLGFSSIWQYARERLGFSKTKVAYFLRLARSFKELPALKESVRAGEVTWTQAREVVKVATPRTERRWIHEARGSSRRDLERKIATTRARARLRRKARGQGDVLEASEPGVGDGRSLTVRSEGDGLQVALLRGAGAPEVDRTPGAGDVTEVPVTVTLRFLPEQYARWEAALARLQSSGESKAREDLALFALETAVGITRVNSANFNENNALPARDGDTGHPSPQPLPAEDPRVQVFVRRCPDCESAAAITTRGDLPVNGITFERLLCEARVHEPGGRNRARVPKRLRRAVLERDGYRCQGPGCGRTRFIEVHHRSLRENGGRNRMENLVVLCSGCHDAFHEVERRRRGAPLRPSARSDTGGAPAPG